jgi:hypothetical protein
VRLQWHLWDWCAHIWAPYWSKTLIWSNPIFGFWVLFRADVTEDVTADWPLVMWGFRCILTLSIQFFDLTREHIASQQTAESPHQRWRGIHSSSFHAVCMFWDVLFALHAVFCHKKLPITLDCSIAISLWHTFEDVLFVLRAVIWSQRGKRMHHVGSWAYHALTWTCLWCVYKSHTSLLGVW